MPHFPDCAVAEVTDARVFVTDDGQHMVIITPQNAICTRCQSPTCRMISHARALMAPAIPAEETCPRCGGDGEVLAGIDRDPESGIYDTALVWCPLCFGSGRVKPEVDAEYRSAA